MRSAPRGAFLDAVREMTLALKSHLATCQRPALELLVIWIVSDLVKRELLRPIIHIRPNCYHARPKPLVLEAGHIL